VKYRLAFFRQGLRTLVLTVFLRCPLSRRQAKSPHHPADHELVFAREGEYINILRAIQDMVATYLQLEALLFINLQESIRVLALMLSAAL